MAELIYKDEVYAKVGVAMEVYNTLGDGFFGGSLPGSTGGRVWKKVDPFHPSTGNYRRLQRYPAKKGYVADFLVYDKIIVEIKALDNLTERKEAQLINYRKATGMELGVLINFGSHPDLQWKRMVATTQKYRLPRSIKFIRED